MRFYTVDLLIKALKFTTINLIFFELEIQARVSINVNRTREFACLVYVYKYNSCMQNVCVLWYFYLKFVLTIIWLHTAMLKESKWEIFMHVTTVLNLYLLLLIRIFDLYNTYLANIHPLFCQIPLCNFSNLG